MQQSMYHIAVPPIVHCIQLMGNAIGVVGGRDKAILYSITLSPNPSILFVLWQDYAHRIGGCKAINHFT
eukprot:6202043-Ditylum_brightwellii.AAC.1